MPKCSVVGGSVYARENAELSLPKCSVVGGSVYARENAVLSLPGNVKKNDPDAVTRCRESLLSSFRASGYCFADGILARIVSQRGRVSRVVICGKTKVSYVVADDEGNYAHGANLAEARADLMVKRSSKDLTQFRSWKLDKVVSKADAILAYRSITGACSQGTRLWLEQHKTPESLTVGEVVKLTQGAYGAETFAKFFGASR